MPNQGTVTPVVEWVGSERVGLLSGINNTTGNVVACVRRQGGWCIKCYVPTNFYPVHTAKRLTFEQAYALACDWIKGESDE